MGSGIDWLRPRLKLRDGADSAPGVGGWAVGTAGIVKVRAGASPTDAPCGGEVSWRGVWKPRGGASVPARGAWLVPPALPRLRSGERAAGFRAGSWPTRGALSEVRGVGSGWMMAAEEGCVRGGTTGEATASSVETHLRTGVSVALIGRAESPGIGGGPKGRRVASGDDSPCKGAETATSSSPHGDPFP